MPRFNFCGPTYTAQSSSASAEEAINWYVQMMESDGKSRAIMLPSSGLKLFCALADPKVRGIFYFNGRCFAVGQSFYEIFVNGTFTNYGAVTNDVNMASIAAGQNQVLIASGGNMYVFNMLINTLSGALVDPVKVLQVGYGDGYFVALVSNPLANPATRLRVSAITDASTWPGAQVIQVSYFPDDIIGMIFEHRELIIAGSKQTVFYGDTGSNNIFDPIPSGFLEMGAAAAFGGVKLDNTWFFIGANEQGQAMGWRTNGYTPVRVTTHAVETAWQSYVKVSDAVSYVFQEQGHNFWHVYFPTVDALGTTASWRYDVSTGLWHKVGSWNAAFGHYDAHKSQCHAFAFGKHLVGDWNSGNIYEMSSAYADDAGTLIRRVRRAPYIASEEAWIAHFKLQVLLESGLALSTGQGSAPLINLRFSDDGGHTWSNEYSISAGLIGEFKARAIWRRLGRSRGRVYEISVSDPIPWRLIDAYINDSEEPAPVQRLTDRLRSQA